MNTIEKPLFSLLLGACFGAACIPLDLPDTTEPTPDGPPTGTAEQLLVGDWAWQPDVSVITIDDAMQAVQWSALAPTTAADAEYRVSTLDDTLILDGWFPTAEDCAQLQRCDAGRLSQVHVMTFTVDDDLWLPFALLPQNQSPDIYGSYEGTALRFDRLGPDEADLILMSMEQWHITLHDDGSYERGDTRTWFVDVSDPAAPVELPEGIVEVVRSEYGVWHLSGQSLQLTSDDGAVSHYLYYNGVVSLENLVFERQ